MDQSALPKAEKDLRDEVKSAITPKYADPCIGLAQVCKDFAVGEPISDPYHYRNMEIKDRYGLTLAEYLETCKNVRELRKGPSTPTSTRFPSMEEILAYFEASRGRPRRRFQRGRSLSPLPSAKPRASVRSSSMPPSSQSPEGIPTRSAS